MIAFVTSMRHPANAENYAYNEDLLQATLASVTQQSNEDYIVFVVGNTAPSFKLPPKVKFVEVDFDPPARVNGPHADRDGFVRDKGSKIGAGLLAAKAYDPDWVMIFDADDFIHRDLAEFANRNKNASGWIIEDGWIYSRSRNGYRHQPEFNRTCGTSYVIPFSAYHVPEGIDSTASQQEIVDAFGDVLPNIMGAHRNARTWHESQGRTLAKLPFAGAVYHVDTGENHSGKALVGVIRPWNRKLDELYGVKSNASWSRTVASCLGPIAWAWSALKFGAMVARAIGIRKVKP